MAKWTVERIIQLKGREKIAALTAYDYAMAGFLDAQGIPLLLVGDSLGMVVLGYEDTTLVTMEEMEHHVRAAARARPEALLAADMSFGTYNNIKDAVRHAQRLCDAGAEAVKAEGGREILPQVEAIVARGIPFLGHLGMLPQHVREEGGYHIKGKSAEEARNLAADAEALQAAGAFAIVLELVHPKLAAELTSFLAIPTIGIGSGSECDGQILVTTDLLGTSPGFIPKHVRPNPRIRAEMAAAVQQWKADL